MEDEQNLSAEVPALLTQLSLTIPWSCCLSDRPMWQRGSPLWRVFLSLGVSARSEPSSSMWDGLARDYNCPHLQPRWDESTAWGSFWPSPSLPAYVPSADQRLTVEKLLVLPPLGKQKQSKLLGGEMTRVCIRGERNSGFFNCHSLQKLPRELGVLLPEATCPTKSCCSP